ncbi:hypothetical protein BDP67DRAFT_497617 [Colletotrichum lupini]|nr:hypothetical protein BDP67DRAFT_497617 [Colletotrichum lupini]
MSNPTPGPDPRAPRQPSQPPFRNPVSAAPASRSLFPSVPESIPRLPSLLAFHLYTYTSQTGISLTNIAYGKSNKIKSQSHADTWNKPPSL